VELDYDIKARLYALEARYLRRIGAELARYLPHESPDDAMDAALVEMERAEATMSDAVAAQRFIGERHEIYATAMDLAMQAEPTRRSRERLVLLSERARARLCVRGADSTRPSARTDAHEWLLNVRERLGPQSQIVSFHFVERRLVAWVVDGARLEVVETRLTESRVGGLVSRVHEPLHRRSEVAYEALAELADELMPALVDAGLRVALRGTRPRLIVIPHGWLHDLPFELLPIDDGGHMLLDAADVVYSPSISAWLAGQTAQDAHLPPRRVLHVTNPETTKAPDRGLPAIGSADAIRGLLEALGPEEMHTLHRHQATPSAVLDEAERSDLVHVTAHARHLGDAGTGAGIILSPGGPTGLLQAEEIVRRRLEGAPLVVLPVCEGARPSWRPGEGGMGLPWAWLSAGARGVVAPIAQVEEGETLELIREFYARLTDQGAVRALCEARRVCRDRSPHRGAWPALRYYE
jgi:CHAT domain-containing protein